MLGLRRITASTSHLSHFKTRAMSSFSFNRVTVEGNDVLNNVSFRVEKGDKVALMGSSEEGKSTIMNILKGSIYPTRGDIKFLEGNKVLLYQSAIPSNDAMSTISSFLMKNLPGPSAANKSVIENVLRSVKLSDVRPARTISALSLSQQARVQMAAVLLQKPDIILFDHPTDDTTGLSHDDVEDLKTFISESSTTCVIHSNDEDFMDSVATSILHLDEDVPVGESTVSLLQSTYSEAKKYIQDAKERAIQEKAEAVRQEKVEALKHSRSPDVVAELDRIGFENLEAARSQEQYIQAMLLIMILHPPAVIALYKFGFLSAII
mmetsp:Transcript_7730/g.11473  ORF Transcript_7730/g.11473 Transcript_7730/m.11473 type:complete len:321 (-) Transcript_7730:121-1083(-)